MLVAGACAPVSEYGIETTLAAKPLDPSLPYDPSSAEKVVAFAFDAIQDRYLNAVTVHTVAVEGLRGLASLEPTLKVAEDAGRVIVTVGDRKVAEYEAPQDQDVRGWAQLAVAAAIDSRAGSDKIHKADAEAVYQAMFEASLAKLDPFSRYASAETARENRASRNGFGGVGLRYDSSPEGLTVTEVVGDAPAGHAGLKPGDLITAIDGSSTAGMDKQVASKLLRGAIGSDVTLTVRREAGTSKVAMRRALVVPSTVAMSIERGIANVKISGFNQRTSSELAHAVRDAKAQLGPDLKGMVLDLRGNPGGLLDQAVAMADLFVARGPIVSTRGRHPNASQSYDANPGDMGEDLPLVVVVDGKSASASEILAAALQDAGRAVVIGTNSYGKGTVQTVIRLPNDGEMTLTWSRFHSPTGYALHGLGVQPTVCTVEEHSDPLALVKATYGTSAQQLAKVMAAWRHTPLEQADARKELRTGCPSTRHADSTLEPEVARILLSDHATYAKALSVDEPIAIASRPGMPNAAAPAQAESSRR